MFSNGVKSTARSLERRWAHSVRVIALQDIPQRAQSGQIATVKAGYARNFLIPQKHAVYATRENIVKYNATEETEEKPEAVKDPDRQEADRLQYYMRNKVLKIWRQADPVTDLLSVGVVDARQVRKKLSKQLLIDLEPHENIHLSGSPSVELPDDTTFGNFDEPCKTEIRQLGDYWARISLKGGYSIPFRFQVLKR